MYKETDVVRVAKRLNNNKRKYLVLNNCQGKHLPAKSDDAFTMFDELANVVMTAYKDERILVIGFAETATAIGARLAIKLGAKYIQTTREEIGDCTFLHFEEAHSHAPEQKIIYEDLLSVIGEIDRIIFAEDELTTGNTIINLVNAIKSSFDDKISKKIRFSVASLINGMDDAAINRFEKFDNYDNENESSCGIRYHYLIKTDQSGFSDIAEKYVGDGAAYFKNDEKTDFSLMTFSGYMNARRMVDAAEYETACNDLVKQVNPSISSVCSTSSCDEMKILVLGTEEFMYPALNIATSIYKGLKDKKDKKVTVKCHSTTRSPISSSKEEDYPIKERFELVSPYDYDRVTYIYNLDKYDKVFVVTDAYIDEENGNNGIYSIVNALKLKGNDDITVIRWC